MLSSSSMASPTLLSEQARVRRLFRLQPKTRKKPKLLAGDYELGPTVGFGIYSLVHLGAHKDSGRKVALKFQFTSATGDMSETKRQTVLAIELMTKVDHKHILKLVSYDLDAIYSDGRKCSVLALEHAPNGELFHFVVFIGCFNGHVSRTYFHQLIDGLEVIHAHGYAHCNLKPENLLLDKNYVLKIADFRFIQKVLSEGFPEVDIKRITETYSDSRDSGTGSDSLITIEEIKTDVPTESSDCRVATVPRLEDLDSDTVTSLKPVSSPKGYSAPEVLHSDKYLQSADVFATGVILFIMYAGFPPFNDAVATDWWWARLEAGWKERALGSGRVVDRKGHISKHGLFWAAHERSHEFPVDLQDFLMKLMHYDAGQRPTIDQMRTQLWSFYQTPPRVYGKKESKRRKSDASFIRRRASSIISRASGKTIVDGPSWFHGPVMSQTELREYLETSRDTVRGEETETLITAKRKLEQREAGCRRYVSSELSAVGRSEMEYFLAEIMEERALKLDPEDFFGQYIEELNGDALFCETPYAYFTRMLPRITMATIYFVARQLDFEARISCNYEMVQAIVETKLGRGHEEVDGDLPQLCLPSVFSVQMHLVPGTARSNPLFVVSCKRLAGDPLVFKEAMRKFWGHQLLLQLRYTADSAQEWD